MRVISNTSPLIALAKLDKLNLLAQVFGKVLIPQLVYKELERGCFYQEVDCFKVACDSFIEVVNVQNNRNFKRSLDLGECAVLSLALEIQADIVLIDDRKAFNEAKELGLKTMSTLTFLKVAQTKGFIDNYLVLVSKLAENKFFIPNY
jgi:predicted nucleic acid-binding protein